MTKEEFRKQADGGTAEAIYVFYYSKGYADSYTAEDDDFGFGSNKRLAVVLENDVACSFEYTYISDSDTRNDAVLAHHQGHEARIVWQGHQSDVVYFGPAGQWDDSVKTRADFDKLLNSLGPTPL